ncbi:MAG: carboxypeptidase regulatory-like domain-containing protein [Acidobacteria bacterium]|nr:carboxypeptidase regulatory-like domain-containing protein [Acidobacteriota bacterium]
MKWRIACVLAAWAAALAAQTSTSATVLGTVTDATGAVIPSASIELLEITTNQARSVASSESGLYLFAGVLPGKYKMTVSKAGFRQWVLEELDLRVAKSYTLNASLEVGAVTETVQVTAGAGVELQVLDATVGAVLDINLTKAMPSMNRCAAGFMTLQPLVTPTRGLMGMMAAMQGGVVAGSRSDQNTFHLDGADATDFTAGTNQYVFGAVDFMGPTPVVPVPLESIEEFRVSVTNPNATFGRTAGGQVSFVTRRGGNALHGSAYWYHQNDNLNANTWTFNRLGIRKPELKEQRFGTSLGGPLVRDKLFLYGHYQGRRFPQTGTVTRLVPSSDLKQGMLRFYDAAGNVRSYRILDYDPRGRGLSPVISRLWALLPAGNDFSAGDGLNTMGYTGPADASLRMDFGVARLDYHLTSKLRLTSTYRYSTHEAKDTSQVDIAGLTGGRPGEIRPVAATPVEPRFFTAQLAGSLRPTLINEATFGYVRSFWAYRRTDPFPQVPGTAAAVMVAQGTLDSGLDVDTLRARARLWRDHLWQFSDNLSWLRGKHSLQFGGSLRHQPVFRELYDKVTGSLTTLVYELNAATAAGISSAARPPTCAAGQAGNCLRSGDVQRWNDLFAAGLGIVDKAGVIAVRDSEFRPLPPGTPMRTHSILNTYEVYVNDIWRITPSLTLTAGLLWSIAMPPVERDGLQNFMVDASTKQILDIRSFLDRRRAAAERGEVYNPTLGWVPIRQSGRQRLFDVDWNNAGPRVSAAWNPSFREGLLGRIFGERKTVLRGGYGATFDRLNGFAGPGSRSEVPLFAPTLNCIAPRTDGTCPGSSSEANAFRIGVDGSAVPLPALRPVSLPYVPGAGEEPIVSNLDPTLRPGRTQALNFTIQRELPANLLLEMGYVGRWSNDLSLRYQYNSVPYMMRDPASGQTFAQAFDTVAQQLRAGRAAAAVAPQPWFENQLRGNARCGASCTQFLAGARSVAFQQGQLNNLVNYLNAERPAGPIYSRQVTDLQAMGNGGRSNYNAGFLSVTRRFAQGLTLTGNYTLSKSLDQFGLGQMSVHSFSNSYNLDADYGPSLWDRTHVFNGYYYYELPFGPGKRFGASGRALGRLTGGWSVSGIVTASSGLPLSVNQHHQVFGGTQLQTSGSFTPGALPIVPGSKHATSANHGVSGSGGVGVTGDPARRGTGLNLFANPEEVFRNFRPVLVSQDTRHGRGVIRGLARWNWDVAVAKSTRITERLRATFSADFFNILNRVEFADPTLSLFSPAAFGVLSAQYGNPRQIQLGLRLDF